MRTGRAGERAAFDSLYLRYERSLFGFLLRYLGNRQDAEEVFHETFLAALSGRLEIAGPGSFRAWIFRVGRNLCLNRLRARGRGEKACETLAREELDSSTELREVPEAALEGAVEALPPRLAEVYRLRAAGLSYEEMAALLEVPSGTIKSRVHEMVARLREELKPWAVN